MEVNIEGDIPRGGLGRREVIDVGNSFMRYFNLCQELLNSLLGWLSNVGLHEELQ